MQIVFEDEHLLVINKPSGWHSSIVGDSRENTIAGLLLEKYPGIAEASLKPEDAGLVNRLDFPTSGALLAAKNRKVWEKLREQLLAGEIEKSYLALVEGLFPETPVTAQSFLGNPNRNAKKIRVYHKDPGPKARALPARTEFRLIRQLLDQQASLIRATAHVARRHQIRAHAADLGYPLVGDALYGSNRLFSSICPKANPAPEFFLHAGTLKLQHPATGKLLELEIPQPSYEISSVFN